MYVKSTPCLSIKLFFLFSLKVKFSLFAVEPAIVELLKMKFQGEGSDYKSWFKTSTILESPWSDLTAGSTVYIGSMEGSDVT